MTVRIEEGNADDAGVVVSGRRASVHSSEFSVPSGSIVDDEDYHHDSDASEETRRWRRERAEALAEARRYDAEQDAKRLVAAAYDFDEEQFEAARLASLSDANKGSKGEGSGSVSGPKID